MKKLWSLLLALAMVLTGVSALASEPGTMPIAENPGDITLRIAVTDHPAIEDWNTNEFVKWLSETTNINFEFELIPLEGRLEKLSLILASGDYPDIFMSVGMTDALISRYGVEEGMFLPLNDLIDQYGVETKRMYEQFPAAEGRMTQLDGNIYALPNINECYHCTAANKFWINQRWLDNLGLEQPTTIDEFYDVLVAFRDQDANGNGDPSDEIPFAGDYDDGWNTNPERFILNAFTYYPLDLDITTSTQDYAFGLYLDGDEVTVPFYKDELKDGLKFMAKLSEEGLLYPGSFTQNLTQLTQLAESDTLGASAGGYILFAEVGGDAYRSYAPLLPIAGPDGYQSSVSYPHDAIVNNYFVISADCENPEAAFRVGDLLYTYDATIRSYYGVKGVDWDDPDPDEGLVGINGEPAMYKLITPWQEAEPQNQHVVQMCLAYRDAAFRLGEPSDPTVDLYTGEGLETLLYQVTADYKPYTHDEMVLPPLKFTDAQNDEMSVMKAELNTAIKEGMTAFMTGSRDVDAEYDNWMAELESKGLSSLVEYYQNAYDAQYK